MIWYDQQDMKELHTLTQWEANVKQYKKVLK